jgi:magnesium chelatase subunit D
MGSFNDVYPFSAIVGQDKMKKALMLNAINPKIGGVLIRGEKGTAKSTAARALANLLPDIEVVADCAFGCDPHDKAMMCASCRSKNEHISAVRRKMKVVELPISSTEDKVVGTLDIEQAIKKGEKKFEPGILAQANRNILYVDEVNLLNDHIVDVLLDVAAMGVNIVEREGISYSHPSSFILVGTMNPEEGELRPQLLDRFGLCVEIEGIRDADTRMEIVARRINYEKDPDAFVKKWADEEKKLRDTIVWAKEIINEVAVSDEMLRLIVDICIEMQVDGHRADLAMIKTASAIAALNLRTGVTEMDVKEAAELVLKHRMRRKPFEQQKMDNDRLEKTIQKNKEKSRHEHKHENSPAMGDSDGKPEEMPDASSETFFPEGRQFKLNQSALKNLTQKDSKVRNGPGRRSVTNASDGRYVRSAMPDGPTRDIALDATIRAAAPYQIRREGPAAVNIENTDIRKKVRERKIGNTIIFVVDASGSMGAESRMTAVKGAILSILMDAYRKRDRVGLVAFKGDSADLLLLPTGSVELARKQMQELPVGGKTPLARGLLKGYDVIKKEMEKNRDVVPLMVVVSDGKANVSLNGGKPMDEAMDVATRIGCDGINSLVIDSECGFIKLGAAELLSNALGGRYLKLENLEGDSIIGAINDTKNLRPVN